MIYPAVFGPLLVKQHIIFDAPPYNLEAVVRPVSWQFEDGGWITASNWHYFCPKCGDVWCRAVFDASTSFGSNVSHVPVMQPCSKHPSTKWYVAGSLLQRSGEDGWPHDLGLFEFLPETLLAREFALHEAHYERYIDDSN